MNRRDAALALAALGITLPSAQAQQAGRLYRVGYLSTPSRKAVERVLDSFLTALRNLGWVEGKNLLIEYRWADGNIERLPALAAELVKLKVELIIAPAATAVAAAKNATTNIPIVMIFPNDPVASGFVANLRQPGGNITGTAGGTGLENLGKQLQLLKEIDPRISRVSFIWDTANVDNQAQLKTLETAGRALRIQIHSLKLSAAEEFEAAFTAMVRNKSEGLLVSRDGVFLVNRKKLAELAVKNRLPAMYGQTEYVEDGGLASYGVNQASFIGQAARYVDKILKGAKPGDLPVEQPTRFEFIVNLKTAKALGLKMPDTILLRADRVIE